tara:strand:- start:2313 stop:3197 length:885 start_codon:yes stop_codon:yes gene_type:complete
MFFKIYSNLLHWPNKIFYPLKNFDNNESDTFKKIGFKHYKFDKKNKNFANEVREKIKDTFLEENITKSLYKNPKSYTIDLFDNLEIDLKKKIESFFNNDQITFKVNSFLGLSMKLRNIKLMYNFYNKNTIKNEGPKMFHKDSDSLQDQIKIFFLINQIDKNNGMFYFIPNNILQADVKLPFERSLMQRSVKDKWRNFDETVISGAKKINKNLVPDEIIRSLDGNSGEMLFVDTGKIYHKGGYITDKDKYRLLIQATYTPRISLSNWNKQNNKFLNYLMIKMINLKFKLMKTIKI